MEKQKKNDSGITLVALVVSIIVMLVLAGVSLNATIGENGIVTRAQEAAIQQRVANQLEELNLELAKLNIDTITTDEVMAINDIASYLVSQGTIDNFVRTSSNQIAAGIDTATGNKYFFGVKDNNTYRITRGTDGLLSAELTTYTSGGDITGGYALITADSFNNDNSLPAEEKGKFTITSDAEVVFMDTVSGALSIYVKSGIHATVGIYADLTLTNANIGRSAIDIESGGTLDLFIGEKEAGENAKLQVDSGFGGTAPINVGNGAVGGNGGYAGIHVPKGSKLNVYGNGIIYAYGGDAGDGGTAVSGNAGGGGGGGAGAGIGGNGGKGGDSNTRTNLWRDGYSGKFEQAGRDGDSGEDCGEVNIHGTITVYAYGGAGGSGGIYSSQTGSSGTGGGGYPAAGIGGGGAGGGGADHANGAGGYTGGMAENGTSNIQSFNGINSFGETLPTYQPGSSYFSVVTDKCRGGGYYDPEIGGQGGSGTNEKPQFWCDSGGDGGTAGQGGNIKVSNTSFVYAYNGNMITDDNFDYSNSVSGYNIDGTSTNRTINKVNYKENKYIFPTEIFAQAGILRNVYKTNAWWDTEPRKNASYYKSLLGTTVISTIDDIEAATDYTELEDIRIRAQYIENSNTYVLKTKYKNTLNNNSIYGVGSGAGYIEVSNGTYTVYNEDSNGNFTTVYTGT